MLKIESITFTVYSVNVWENADILECAYMAKSEDGGDVCLVFVHFRDKKIINYEFFDPKSTDIEKFNGHFENHVRCQLNMDRIERDINASLTAPIRQDGIIDQSVIPNFEYIDDEYG